MQFGSDTTLRLLIVDDSVEAAEAIISGLRNSGIAVRPTRPDGEDDLCAMLASNPPDLLIAARDARSVPLERVMQLVDASGKDLPVLMLVDAVDDERLLQITTLGARGVVLRGHKSQIEHSVRAEWTDLHAAVLRRIEAQMRETERRCDALISSSRDPIAYVHEGMHIRANEAYLEMFGSNRSTTWKASSLLDMVAPQHVDGFKQLLKSLSKGEAPPPQYQVDARNQDGAVFAATMEFTPATYEGESCLQVVFRRRMEVDPELAREVEDLRQRDQVTGLLNRADLPAHVENAVADAGRRTRAASVSC